MKKVYIKLIALSLTLALSVTMVVAASYAWVVLTTTPEVSGIQITIGGGNTILVAADLSKTVDGVVYHYPDKFSDSLNFGQHETYAYLQTLDGLMPVSTADGINWFLPEYYDASDPEVKEGKIPAGQMKAIVDFLQECDLSHANLSGADEELLAEGSYIYLDFWVVSPGTDCTLRISVPTVEGDNSGGSFLLDLPRGVAAENGFTLKNGELHAAAMFRVGFLTNSDTLVDNTMVHYMTSSNYDERYRTLRGSYAEPGTYQLVRDTDRFTIYEPNCDYHPTISGMDGAYIPTSPIGLVNGKVQEVSVLDRVMAQKHSTWILQNNGQTILEQVFQTAITGKDLEEEELTGYFYNTYLQGQLMPYVNKGWFYKRTSDLASYNGTVPGDAVLDTAGATDDVYIIELERNVPQRIRMFIWLEGQDADCTNIVSASSLVLNLEFAGSTETHTKDDE